MCLESVKGLRSSSSKHCIDFSKLGQRFIVVFVPLSPGGALAKMKSDFFLISGTKVIAGWQLSVALACDVAVSLQVCGIKEISHNYLGAELQHHEGMRLLHVL